jgi:hypothetical protein
MLRHLLTMLALITGLAASAAPVEARVARADGAQVQLASESVAVVRAQALALREIRPRPQFFVVDAVAMQRLAVDEIAAPAVRTGVDRALE